MTTDSFTAPFAMPLLSTALPLFKPQANILDLACGSGRNGLQLAAHGFATTLLDRDQVALQHIKSNSPANTLTNCTIVCGDLESANPYQLPVATYDAILVFRYLHRPLMPQIIAALQPGGLIVYETFTHQQAAIGRPRNPNFLLNDQELLQWFEGFTVLHFFEGYCPKQQAYISQLIAQKPALKKPA
ncbi:MAG: class I SAM-dependent methyltransferase [Gammaproteobacteria bacterium]|nr:class I SAM-dependent methyltransferase [Gammaproteobacteria bacterium]